MPGRIECRNPPISLCPSLIPRLSPRGEGKACMGTRQGRIRVQRHRRAVVSQARLSHAYVRVWPARLLVQRMIPGGSNNERLTDADSIATTAVTTSCVHAYSCLCCLRRDSCTRIMVIYERSDAVEHAERDSWRQHDT